MSNYTATTSSLHDVFNEYTPNFADPRVLNRIKRAYGFSRACISTDEPHPWAKMYIDQFFGQQQNPLSKWLREILLVPVDSWFVRRGACLKQARITSDPC